MATTKSKKVIKGAQKFDLDNVIVKVKDSAKDVNEFMLENSDAFVQEAIVRGEQWQDVAAKAVKGGLKLSANTQDIVFDTLDTLKGQLIDSSARMKNLFSKN